MQTENTVQQTLPLYKRLNEQRTQGEWHKFADTIQNEEHKIMDVCTQNKGCKNNWEANAQYTALAVNNLHHLAEMLEKILKIEDAAFSLKSFDVKRLKSEIQQTLSKIS